LISVFFFSSRRRHTRFSRDWSSDVCSSDLKDTHTTGSQAALVGGTTTYIEMMAPSRNEDLMAGYRNWTALAEGNSACDYSFHIRSEERRVGKEWRSEWSQWPSKYKYMESLL